MKNVIIEARENANLHIVHLEPICSFIEEIDAGFTKSITFEGAYSTILAYNRALAQPLTQSMFHAKTGLFEGFEKVKDSKSGAIFVNGKLEIEFVNATKGSVVFAYHITPLGDSTRPKTLRDLALFTQDNPLKLRQ